MRPLVRVNCAMSADGKIAGRERKQVRISSDGDMDRVKALRKEFDCIMVGVGTVLADDPHLTIKNAPFSEQPLRLVVDPHGRVPAGARVLDGGAPTAVATSSSCARTWNGVDAIRCGEPFDARIMMDLLGERGVKKVLVEGGGETIAALFRAGLVDEYTVFVGSLVIGGRDSPTPADGDGWVKENGVKLELMSVGELDGGALLTYRVLRPQNNVPDR
jgi:2,5-diamino-6-(ribosylamino)-4(3H)-pyrimidinone 5'-phosphate reductase